MDKFTVVEKFNDIGRIGLWAPGNYEGACTSCGEHFVGDKRASQCLPCAVKVLKERHEHLNSPASRENRIEALRAASRIVAGYCANPLVSETEDDYIHGSWTIEIAEHFAKWLEAGDR